MGGIGALFFHVAEKIEQGLFGICLKVGRRFEASQHPPAVGVVELRQNIDPGIEQFLRHHGAEEGVDVLGEDTPGQSPLPLLHAPCRLGAPSLQVDPQDFQGIPEKPQSRIEKLFVFPAVPSTKLFDQLLGGPVVSVQIAAKLGLAGAVHFERAVLAVSLHQVRHPPGGPGIIGEEGTLGRSRRLLSPATHGRSIHSRVHQRLKGIERMLIFLGRLDDAFHRTRFGEGFTPIGAAIDSFSDLFVAFVHPLYPVGVVVDGLDENLQQIPGANRLLFVFVEKRTGQRFIGVEAEFDRRRFLPLGVDYQNRRASAVAPLFHAIGLDEAVCPGLRLADLAGQVQAHHPFFGIREDQRIGNHPREVIHFVHCHCQ